MLTNKGAHVHIITMSHLCIIDFNSDLPLKITPIEDPIQKSACPICYVNRLDRLATWSLIPPKGKAHYSCNPIFIRDTAVWWNTVNLYLDARIAEKGGRRAATDVRPLEIRPTISHGIGRPDKRENRAALSLYLARLFIHAYAEEETKKVRAGKYRRSAILFPREIP